MLTIVKEENGFTIERYIDDDGDIEKFNKLIALKKYFYTTSHISKKLAEEIDNENQYYQYFLNILTYSENKLQEKYEFKPY